VTAVPISAALPAASVAAAAAFPAVAVAAAAAASAAGGAAAQPQRLAKRPADQGQGGAAQAEAPRRRRSEGADAGAGAGADAGAGAGRLRGEDEEDEEEDEEEDGAGGGAGGGERWWEPQLAALHAALGREVESRADLVAAFDPRPRWSPAAMCEHEKMQMVKQLCATLDPRSFALWCRTYPEYVNGPEWARKGYWASFAGDLGVELVKRQLLSTRLVAARGAGAEPQTACRVLCMGDALRRAGDDLGRVEGITAVSCDPYPQAAGVVAVDGSSLGREAGAYAAYLASMTLLRLASIPDQVRIAAHAVEAGVPIVFCEMEGAGNLSVAHDQLLVWQERGLVERVKVAKYTVETMGDVFVLSAIRTEQQWAGEAAQPLDLSRFTRRPVHAAAVELGALVTPGAVPRTAQLFEVLSLAAAAGAMVPGAYTVNVQGFKSHEGKAVDVGNRLGEHAGAGPRAFPDVARDILAHPGVLVEARVLADARLMSLSCLSAFLGPAPTDAHVHLYAAWLEGFFLCRSPSTYDTTTQSFLLGTAAGRKKGGEQHTQHARAPTHHPSPATRNC